MTKPNPFDNLFFFRKRLIVQEPFRIIVQLNSQNLIKQDKPNLIKQ